VWGWFSDVCRAVRVCFFFFFFKDKKFAGYLP